MRLVLNTPRYEYRLNGCRFAAADPAQALAAATVVVALADARSGIPGARHWLSEGAGRAWAALLGADALLADVLAEID